MSVVAYLKDVPLPVRLEAVRQLSLLGEDPAPLLDAAFEPGEASVILEDSPPQFGTCKHGHPWSDENTYIDPAKGQRKCRTCSRLRSAAYRAEHGRVYPSRRARQASA